ncbi:hypothetical protein ACO34A_28735 (plasmid) [Rhizobium sp. ACO-34A]|nr:hypothetical protein ACO34A_28735 [Rhizobium sp. ACO-34A]
MIPYIDMGMDVHRLGDSAKFLVAGQVVLSSPGTPCLRCFGIVTDNALTDEAAQYGDAGGKPQVVWPNGILASTAVGLLVQLFTPWHGKPVRSAYFAFDASEGTLVASDRLRRRAGMACHHFPAEAVGDPMFDVRHIGGQGDRETDIMLTSIPVLPGWRAWRSAFYNRFRRWFTE